jgi:hypothetical protein
MIGLDGVSVVVLVAGEDLLIVAVEVISENEEYLTRF